MAKENDTIALLLNAADRIDEMPRADLQVLLRKAAVDIATLGKLVGIRDEVWRKTAPPEENG